MIYDLRLPAPNLKSKQECCFLVGMQELYEIVVGSVRALPLTKALSFLKMNCEIKHKLPNKEAHVA
jgi:hypothetical protein